VCSFVCCVSFDRGVILCDVCYLFVVSYCKPLPPGKTPFAVNKYYITLHYRTLEFSVKNFVSVRLNNISKKFCEMCSIFLHTEFI
jgi:hypothetical protein